MKEGLLVVALVGLLAAVVLVRTFVRSLAGSLALLGFGAKRIPDTKAGAAVVTGRLRGDGRLPAYAGGECVYSLTTFEIVTRRESGTKTIWETHPLPPEKQPGARVVPLSLCDDDGGELPLEGLDRIEVLDGALETFRDEVTAADAHAKYPELVNPIARDATSVLVRQSVLREGARVVAHGVARLAPAETAGEAGFGYRTSGGRLALFPQDGDVLLIAPASRVRSLAGVGLGAAVTIAAALGLVASSLLALYVAWMVRSLGG